MADHEWVSPAEGKPEDWDGAECAKCGLVATNVQIATLWYGGVCDEEREDE